MRKAIWGVIALASMIAPWAIAQEAARPADNIPTARELAPTMPKPVAPFEWAYPVAPAGLPRPDMEALHTAQGADPSIKMTMRQVGDAFGPPDWFPKEHAPLPKIVAHGEKPHVPACILCHLVSGGGHPESASVGGLSAEYIIAQMHAFRDGDRKNIRAPAMIEMAHAISEKDLKEAAQYYARIPRKRLQWIRVVESSRAPANHVGAGGARFFDPGANTVPLGPDMIYEVAESEEVELRNDHAGFVDYVPMGSLAKGRAVALGKNGIPACAACHGAGYRGTPEAPRLAGRSAYYLIRQLADMRAGHRKGTALGVMKDVVVKLSDADILNVAAYMASRKP
jgi:cytochrome c553